MPTPPEVEAIMESLRGENDIGVAIVASALMEAALERLLTTKFKTKSKDLLGRVFQNEGPLSNFHGKILVAQAFGVITSPLAEEMHRIRAIRNAFAHAKVAISFSNEIVQREVASLKLITTISNIQKVKWEPALAGKRAFLLAVELMLIMLDYAGNHEGDADAALAEALKA